MPSTMVLAPPSVEEVIVDAAQDCFALAGVRATTIDDIATAAGVSRATVYRRVGGRDQVVLAVLVRVTDRHLVRLRPRLVAQPDAASALALLIRATAQAARDDDLQLLFASEERGATGAPIAGALAPLAARFGAAVATIATRFPGRLATDVAPDAAGEWILRAVISLATIELDPPRSAAELDGWIHRFVVPALLESPAGSSR